MLLYNPDWLFITYCHFSLHNGQRGKQSAFNRYFFLYLYPATFPLLALVVQVWLNSLFLAWTSLNRPLIRLVPRQTTDSPYHCHP